MTYHIGHIPQLLHDGMVGSGDLHHGAEAVPNSTKFLVHAEVVQNDAQHTSAERSPEGIPLPITAVSVFKRWPWLSKASMRRSAFFLVSYNIPKSRGSAIPRSKAEHLGDRRACRRSAFASLTIALALIRFRDRKPQSSVV